MSWDNEDFELPSASGGLTNNWEGEDEDLNNVKDSWDAPSDDDTKETATIVEKKKPKAERVAERKAQRRLQGQAEAEQKQEAERQLTAEEQLAEKQHLQKLVEESDLKVAQDLFGGGTAAVGSGESVQDSIESMDPKDDEGFQQFREALVKKITQYEKTLHYVSFLEHLSRDCCAGLNAEGVRQIASALSTLAQEKQRMMKGGTKGKKKGKGPTIGKATAKLDFTAYDDEVGDEFDDFM